MRQQWIFTFHNALSIFSLLRMEKLGCQLVGTALDYSENHWNGRKHAQTQELFQTEKLFLHTESTTRSYHPTHKCISFHLANKKVFSHSIPTVWPRTLCTWTLKLCPLWNMLSWVLIKYLYLQRIWVPEVYINYIPSDKHVLMWKTL